LTKENIKLAFDTFDSNGDGKIEIHEFRQALPKNIKGNLKPIEGLQKKDKAPAKRVVYDVE
jgi:Ca2+-binding EF-hand superfamily protein